MRPLMPWNASVLSVLIAGVPLTAQTTRLVLSPPVAQLDGARDAQQVTLLEVRSDEVTRDRTLDATFRLRDDACATLTRDARSIRLVPKADGDTELIATLDGQEVRIPVRVREVKAATPISFRNEVVPVLTRAGCNAGSCHGAASGKNGFRLSLFGYAPDRDHLALTRELRGRRLDFAAPEQSLVLQKATATAPHQGGKRFEADSPLSATLQHWIEGGAADDAARAPALQSLELWPSSAVLIGKDSALPLLVRARYADGSDRDVTALALWSTNNEGSVKVDAQGRASAVARGEAALLARYGGLAAVAAVQVHDSDAPFSWPGEAEANFVDTHVHDKLRRARTLPAPLAEDATFVRRIHVDLLGVLPTPAEARAFLADQRSDKRERLVDALLARPEFAAAQAMAWADVLQVDEQTMERKGAALFGGFLRDAFARGRPFDEVVREMLCAEGSNFTVPAANFALVAREPHLVAEKTAQVFLGVRLQCAQCHNHPFERWTMDDYYGFAAFFAQVGRKRGRDPYETVVWNRGNGEVRNLRDNAVSAPRLLGAEQPKIAAGQDRRVVLAQWLTGKDNPLFARNIVNRIWAQLFGRGLIDPVDDVRIGNPASHPALLDALAALLIERGFDLRPVYAAVCKSRAYQRAVAPADVPAALCAGHTPRRLRAEVLLDAIGAVTGVATKYPGLPLGALASELDVGRGGAFDGGRGTVRFLEAFGRPARTSACTCDRSDTPTLGQTLHLINGETIAGKLADNGGRLAQSLSKQHRAIDMLDELFLAAYARRPELEEQARLLATLPAKGDPRAAWEDIYWAVLNSKEFLFQR